MQFSQRKKSSTEGSAEECGERKENVGVAADFGRSYTSLSSDTFWKSKCFVEVELCSHALVTASCFHDVPDFRGGSELESLPPSAGGLLVVANQKEHTVAPSRSRQSPRTRKKSFVGVNGHEVMASKRRPLCPTFQIYGNSGVGRPGDRWEARLTSLIWGNAKLAGHDRSGQAAPPTPRGIRVRTGLLYVTAELANARRRHRSWDAQGPLAEIPHGRAAIPHAGSIQRRPSAVTPPTSAPEA